MNSNAIRRFILCYQIVMNKDLELVRQYVAAIESNQTDMIEHPPNISFVIDLKVIDDACCLERGT